MASADRLLPLVANPPRSLVATERQQESFHDQVGTAGEDAGGGAWLPGKTVKIDFGGDEG
jgi:hypothetical protein